MVLWPSGARWVLVGHPHAPATSTPGKDPVPIVYEAGLVPGPVWTGGKISSLTGIRSLTVQPVISRYTDWATGSTLYQINFRNGASRWFSLQEYITMHGHLNVEFVSTALLWVKEDTSRRILWPVLKYRSDIECLNVLGVWTLFNFHCAGVGRGALGCRQGSDIQSSIGWHGRTLAAVVINYARQMTCT